MVKVTNWGNFPVIDTEIIEENNLEKISDLVLKSKEIIARGNGRCYGDASLGSTIFSTLKLKKIISFDIIEGIMECESGVLLSEILDIIVPKGFFLYVTPGTKYISIGGAIASDIHGKNHHIEGSFSNHLISFKIINESGEIINCSREENQDTFWATIGGMGLSGIIISAQFKLRNIETAYIRQEAIKAKNLNEIFRLFEESENWTYNVAWIDCLAKGSEIGKSILLRGEHALRKELSKKRVQNALKLKTKFHPTIPFYFPIYALNYFVIKSFNWLYYNKQFTKNSVNLISYEDFFYPLDAVKDWNKIYGRNGFIQYQMVIPKADGKKAMKEILETISKSGNGSFLAILKLFGDSDLKAYNSFPEKGYTLALDFKLNDKLKMLVEQLDDIVEKYGGKIYLTKDSMSKGSIASYLRNVRGAKFISMQSKRIFNNL